MTTDFAEGTEMICCSAETARTRFTVKLEMITSSGFNNFGDVTFTQNGTCADDIGFYEVDFWVVDDCGNVSDAVTISYIIEDAVAPTLAAPADIVLECDNGENASIIENWLNQYSVSDNCSDVTVTNDYMSANLPTTCMMSLTVTFTAEDDCGNVSTDMATISIIDEEAPVIMVEPSNLTLECDGAGNTAAIMAWASAQAIWYMVARSTEDT